MAYSVEADLNLSDERLVELTDSSTAPGVKDETVIAREATRAQALCDLYLRRLYVTPVADPVPEELKLIHAAIWRRRLYGHREVMQVPQNVLDDFQWAFDALKSIGQRDGLILDIPKSTVAPVMSATVV